MRAIIGLLVAVLLSGCATASRRQQLDASVADRTAYPQTCPSGMPAPEHPAKPENEPRLIAYELPRQAESSLALWSSETTPVLSSTATGTNAGKLATNSLPTANLFSKDYAKLLLADVKESFTAPARWDTTDWLVMGGVAAGIVTVGAFDQDIQRAVQRNRNGTVNDVFNAVEPFGAEYAPAVLGAFYLGGEIFDDRRAKVVALDGASASLIASVLVLYPMKYAVGRSRPNENLGPYHFKPFSGKDSFPSGHTTEAFALATVISEHYDSLWIKFTSYGVASMVGYARLNNNVHWASDVLAGAALGTCVSHVVVRFNEKHWNMAVQPIIGKDMRGAEFSLWF